MEKSEFFSTTPSSALSYRQSVWVTCPYVIRDGLFNPDVRLVDNTGDFQLMSDAVLYNAITWRINSDDTYAAKAVEYIYNWFINPDTAMTPNLIYSQVHRGPGIQLG